MSDTTLRLRALVAAWRTPIVVAFVLLALLGAAGTYATHVEPPTETEERVTGEWSVNGGFEHGATVTRENPVFPLGTDLGNRTTYFTGASPELDGTFGLSPGTARNVTVAMDAALVLSSTDEEDETYWETTEDIGDRRVEGVDPGEPVELEFAVNASRVDDRLGEIESELGSSPGTPSATVAVDVRVAGTLDGERTTLEFTERLPIALDADTYTVESPGPVSESVRTTEAVAVPREYGPLRSVGAPLLLVLGLASVAGLATLDRRDGLELTDAERDLLEFRDDRAEYDEWIVRVRLPSEAFERPRAEAESLGDLVDFAIDSDTGVVEAPDGDSFHVLGDEYLFTYVAPVGGSDDAETVGAGDAESGGGSDPTAESARAADGPSDATTESEAAADGSSNATGRAAEGAPDDRTSATATDSRSDGDSSFAPDEER